MTTKKQIKNKLAFRKKLIRYDYELDYKDSVRKGLEIFNDKNVGEIWNRGAYFIITKCDFDWKVISSSNNSQTFCECIVFNINSDCCYRASIFINQKIEVYETAIITDHIKRSMHNNIKDRIEKNQSLTHFLFKGNVTCKLFDSEIILKISIPVPEKLLKKYSNITFDDYDWEQENFNALTDGQYGDFDDFDGDWDRLDGWRGS
jgi:hypothetical protein